MGVSGIMGQKMAISRKPLVIFWHILVTAAALLFGSPRPIRIKKLVSRLDFTLFSLGKVKMCNFLQFLCELLNFATFQPSQTVSTLFINLLQPNYYPRPETFSEQ